MPVTETVNTTASRIPAAVFCAIGGMLAVASFVAKDDSFLKWGVGLFVVGLLWLFLASLLTTRRLLVCPKCGMKMQ
jgi:hypothetical protein